MSRVLNGYNLKSLSQDECIGYIQHQLSTIGGGDPDLFEQTALIAVTQASGGLPRRVNAVCLKALKGAMDCGRRSVTAEDIRLASKDWWQLWATYIPLSVLRTRKGSGSSCQREERSCLLVLPHGESAGMACGQPEMDNEGQRRRYHRLLALAIHLRPHGVCRTPGRFRLVRMFGRLLWQT